ncbi:unnamed protein product, partial [Adineta steineri]
VRSQKSTAPSTVRFTTPPQSSRQQQLPPKKVAQSVSVPQTRASPSIDQQIKHGSKQPQASTTHKSLAVTAPLRKPGSDPNHLLKVKFANEKRQFEAINSSVRIDRIA